MKFTIFEAATGRVLFGGTADDPEALVADGQGIHLDVEFADGYFVGEEHFDFPNQPAPHYIFNYATRAWEDPRDLEQIRDAHWEVIKADRDAAQLAPFEWDGSMFDAKGESLSLIQGAALLATLAQMAGQPFSRNWTLADNTVRTMSGAEVIAMGIALGVHIDDMHTRGRLKRVAIYDQALTTKAEIEAITWDSP